MEVRNNWLAVLLIAFPIFAMFSTRIEAMQSLWENFTQLELNERGDALAGIFSPLAFLVAMLALLLQSKELRLSRKQTETTAKTLVEQTKILRDDANRKSQHEKYDFVVHGLNMIRQYLTDGEIEYRSNPDKDGEYYSLLISMGKTVFNADKDADFFDLFRRRLREETPEILARYEQGRLNKMPNEGSIDFLTDALELAARKIDELDPIYGMKMAHYKIPLLLEAINDLRSFQLYENHHSAV